MHFALDAVAVDEDARIEKGLPRMHWSRWNVAAANVFECTNPNADAYAYADADAYAENETSTQRNQ